ncbi:MAG: hypothetical protein Q9186_003958 [Xanthomendoza sp. 1 TL-2023]
MFLQLLVLSAAASALPSVYSRSPAWGDNVPDVGEMSQGAATVLKVVQTPRSDTNVTFSNFVSPSANLRQSDSLVCLVEAVQQIYSNGSGIRTHLISPSWTFSGSDPRNAGCLTIHNQDNKDHILTWGILVEALSAVAMGLSNMTATSCQFDIYNGKWGHLGYGGLGMQYGVEPAAASSGTMGTGSTATS